MSSCSYELYALKYAESMAPHGTRFYGNDPHDGPTPMDFFVWAAVSPERTVAIDCGFTAETSARRRRRFLHTPAEGLHRLGIASETIHHVILTHFHNDHIGNVADFPNASFVVQDREMAFWTGRYASKGGFLWVVEPEDILELVRQNFAGRVRFVDGTAEIVPGITVHHVGVMRLDCKSSALRPRVAGSSWPRMRRTTMPISKRIAPSASLATCLRCTTPSRRFARWPTRPTTSFPVMIRWY